MDDLIQWALVATCEALFGVKLTDPKTKRLMLEAVEGFVQEVSHRTWEPVTKWYLFTDPKRRDAYVKGHAYLRFASRQIFHQAKEQYEQTGKIVPMMDAILKLCGPDNEERAIDEMVLMLAASFQSTGDTVATSLWELAQHPNLQQELYQQVSSSSVKDEYDLFPDGSSQTTADASNLLAAHIWYETLRVHPAIPFSARKINASNTKPVEISDEIKVSIPIHLIYFKFAVGGNPALFTNPTEFDPHRFDTMTTRTEKLGLFLPFGSGKRSCIGQQLAEYMSVYAIKRLVREFEFYHDKTVQENSAIEEELKETKRPESAAAVGVKPVDMQTLKWRPRA